MNAYSAQSTPQPVRGARFFMTMMQRVSRIQPATVALTLVLAFCGAAADAQPAAAVTIRSVAGTCEYRTSDAKPWTPVKVDQAVAAGEELRCARGGRLEFQFPRQTKMRVLNGDREKESSYLLPFVPVRTEEPEDNRAGVVAAVEPVKNSGNNPNMRPWGSVLAQSELLILDLRVTGIRTVAIPCEWAVDSSLKTGVIKPCAEDAALVYSQAAADARINSYIAARLQVLGYKVMSAQAPGWIAKSELFNACELPVSDNSDAVTASFANAVLREPLHVQPSSVVLKYSSNISSTQRAAQCMGDWSYLLLDSCGAGTSGIPWKVLSTEAP